MSESARPVVVHVGLNKTGSTTLQRFVLPRIDGLTVLANRAAPVPHPDDHVIIPAIQSLCDDPDSNFSPGILRLLLDRAGTQSSDQLMISEEAFTATLRNRDWDHLSRTLDRLAAEIPNATIVFVLRNPSELLLSSYAQYVKTGGTLSFEGFVTATGGSDFTFDRRLYNVAEIYFLLADRWGAGRVCPFLHEETAEDPLRFVTRLVQILELQARNPDIDRLADEGSRRSNVSLSPLWMGPERVCNRLTRRTRFNRRPVFGHIPRVHLAVRAALTAVDDAGHASTWPMNLKLRQSQRAISDEFALEFSESNRRFAAATGLDLARYGYAS